MFVKQPSSHLIKHYIFMKKHLTLIILTFSSICAFAQVPNYVPTNGLIGWWPFNGNANDASGNGNNGTVNGATLTTDRFGVAYKAYSFDGIGDNIYIANNFFDNGAVGWSLSVWYNLDQLPNPNNGNSSHILFNTSPHHGISCAMNWGGSSKYSFYLGNGTPAPFWNTSIFNAQSNQNINLNSWKHFALVKSGNTYTLYIDGVFDISWTSTSSISNYFYQMYFGACDPNNSNEVIIGKLDDIGIWNRALTQCEIQDLYIAELNSLNVNAGLDQEICQGQSTSLFGSGASNYSWSNNVVNGVGFVPASSSNYIVTGTDANGCIGTDTMHVELIPTSSSTLTETALDSYTLNGQTYTQSGTYTQVIPNAAGCDSTITLNLSLDFTGISELDKEFSIAPNPATDQLTISTSTLSNEMYILFDPQGRKVLEGSLTGTTTQLDLSKLARGNYLLQIGEKLTPVKLVKE